MRRRNESSGEWKAASTDMPETTRWSAPPSGTRASALVGPLATQDIWFLIGGPWAAITLSPEDD